MASERDTTKIDDQADRLRRMRRNMECGDEMHEIVRRLAEWNEGGPGSGTFTLIASDASSLWAKMQEEARGGDGEASV